MIENEKNISELSIEEKKELFNQIKGDVIDARNSIKQDNYDTIAIIYGKTIDNELVYNLILKDISLNDYTYESYNSDTLQEVDKSTIDLNTQNNIANAIIKYKMLNQAKLVNQFDVNELEKQIDNEILENNTEKLEEQEKELEKENSETILPGLDNDLITKKEENNKEESPLNVKNFEFSSISKIDSPLIDGNQLISEHDSLNSVLKSNYNSYKIMIDKNNTPRVFGIDTKGNITELDSSMFILDSTPSMSIMQKNGLTKNVQVLMSLRINNPGSDVSRNQYIGIGQSNTGISTFYARTNSLNDTKLLARELEKASSLDHEAKIRNIIDRQGNSKISDEMAQINNSIDERNETMDTSEIIGGSSINSLDYEKEIEKRDLGDHGDGSPKEDLERVLNSEKDNKKE